MNPNRLVLKRWCLLKNEDNMAVIISSNTLPTTDSRTCYRRFGGEDYCYLVWNLVAAWCSSTVIWSDQSLSFCAWSSCQRFTAHFPTPGIYLQNALCRALFLSVRLHFTRVHAWFFALAAALQLFSNLTWSLCLVLRMLFGIYRCCNFTMRLVKFCDCFSTLPIRISFRLVEFKEVLRPSQFLLSHCHFTLLMP